MKKIRFPGKILILFIAHTLLCSKAYSQITLDAAYTGAKGKLYMVDLELSGMKYVVKNDVSGNRYLKFYHLNHSLWKTIDCNAFPTTIVPGPTPSVNYIFDAIAISQRIFDCDSLIEFLYFSTTGPKWFTGIYNENGVSKLIADSMGPLCKFNIPNQFKPLYNTPNGARLILSHINGDARVYKLPCVITSTTLITGMTLPNIENLEVGMSIFPNPSPGGLNTIKYMLPTGINNGEISIFDLSGKEVKHYMVDANFSDVVISENELTPGTYIYSLKAEGKLIESKKIIITGN